MNTKNNDNHRSAYNDALQPLIQTDTVFEYNLGLRWHPSYIKAM